MPPNTAEDHRRSSRLHFDLPHGEPRCVAQEATRCGESRPAMPWTMIRDCHRALRHAARPDTTDSVATRPKQRKRPRVSTARHLDKLPAILMNLGTSSMHRSRINTPGVTSATVQRRRTAAISRAFAYTAAEPPKSSTMTECSRADVVGQAIETSIESAISIAAW